MKKNGLVFLSIFNLSNSCEITVNPPTAPSKLVGQLHFCGQRNHGKWMFLPGFSYLTNSQQWHGISVPQGSLAMIYPTSHLYQ